MLELVRGVTVSSFHGPPDSQVASPVSFQRQFWGLSRVRTLGIGAIDDMSRAALHAGYGGSGSMNASVAPLKYSHCAGGPIVTCSFSADYKLPARLTPDL